MLCCVFFLMIRRPPRSTRTDTLFPTRRSSDLDALPPAAVAEDAGHGLADGADEAADSGLHLARPWARAARIGGSSERIRPPIGTSQRIGIRPVRARRTRRSHTGVTDFVAAAVATWLRLPDASSAATVAVICPLGRSEAWRVAE